MASDWPNDEAILIGPIGGGVSRLVQSEESLLFRPIGGGVAVSSNQRWRCVRLSRSSEVDARSRSVT